jgi:hypothetical protein
MNLADYIAEIGDAAFAKKMAITERAAMSYRLKERIPRVELVRRIVVETPVTWAGVYDSDSSRPRSGKPTRSVSAKGRLAT